jgi:hypothetical protein
MRWPLSRFPHQYPADEKTGERDGIDRQLRTSKGSMAGVHNPIFNASARPVEREGPGSNEVPKYWVAGDLPISELDDRQRPPDTSFFVNINPSFLRRSKRHVG